MNFSYPAKQNIRAYKFEATAVTNDDLAAHILAGAAGEIALLVLGMSIHLTVVTATLHYASLGPLLHMVRADAKQSDTIWFPFPIPLSIYDEAGAKRALLLTTTGTTIAAEGCVYYLAKTRD